MSLLCNFLSPLSLQSRTADRLPRMSGDNIVQSSEFMLFGVRVKIDPMRKSLSLNDLSQYEIPIPNAGAGAGDSSAADGVYASADDAVHVSGSRQRKRGVPWTEEEHKFFLLGLQKVGKGDWRGISRNFVKTRTPTQVASHAQKYFLRRTNLNRRRRRSSLFDITTESVTAIPMDQKVPQEDLSPAQLPLAENSINTGPQVYPVSQIENLMEKFTYNNLVHSNYHDSAEITQQVPVFSVPTQTRMVGLNLNQRLSEDPSPLSLNLSLSIDQVNDQFSRYSAFEVKSSFNNGDGMISVA